MSNLIRTISYLKRNGIKNTCYTIKERLDVKHLEQVQREIMNYEGARYFATPEREANAEEVRTQQFLHKFENNYLFSILVPAYETDERYLAEMIDSVMRQTYSKVELIIADASKSDKVKQAVSLYQKEELPLIHQEKKELGLSDADAYPCIRYVRLKKNDGISNNTNEALKYAEGEYIGLLDHDDVLTYDALYEMMIKLEGKPYRMIYSDEDKADGEMKRIHTPNVKPEFNFDLLLSNNYICHFTVLEANLLKKLGFRKEYDGAQDYDLFLRAAAEILGENFGVQSVQGGTGAAIGHIDKVLYHWRCHEGSTAANPESKRYAYEAGKRALHDFLDKIGIDAEAEHSDHLGFYKVDYAPPLWKSRPDIGAVCGKVIKGNKVIGGPILDGRVLFAGLLKRYSGYLNRADFMFDVDGMDERSTLFSPKYVQIFEQMDKEGKTLSFEEKQSYIKEQGDKLVYLPNFDEFRKKVETMS